VASVKPSQEPPGSASGIFESKAGINAKNVTLTRCIRGAYGVEESRIVGGPRWVNEDRFHIEATTAVPTDDHDLMLMLQTLLSDRFKLVFHRVPRTVSGYRLVLGRGGLKAGASEPNGRSVGNSSRGRIDAEGYTLAQFAMRLSQTMHEPVLDATGVAGRFDFKLEWTPDEMQAKPPSADQRVANLPEGPGLFTALQQQIGLKLESGKISVEVLVIDSAEKPSEN
jgi:bla regulator protein blaR1